MAKKYFDNHKLQIAYDYYFSSIECNTWVNIHSILEITSGDNLPKRKMIEGKYQVYGGGGITNNSHNEFNIDFETIGIGRVGARCGCVFNIEKNSWVTDNALLVQSFDERLSLNFIKHYLNFQNLGQFANNAMQPVISKTRISIIKLPIIDLAEQHKIANNLDILENNSEDYKNLDSDLLSKISVVDKWKELTIEIQTQKQLIAQLKQAILQEAIQGKLTSEWRKQNPDVEPASELLERIKAEKAQLIKEKKIKKEKALPSITEGEIPFELPKGWVWCRLGEVTIDVSYGTSQKATENNIGVPVLRMGNITSDGNIIYSNFKYVQDDIKDLPRLYLQKDDLIFNRTNSLELVGKSAVFDVSEPYTLASYLIRVRFLKNIKSLFVMYFINSVECRRNQIEPKVIQQNGQANFNGTKLKNIIVPIPPTEEQKAIVEKVETLMSHCDALEQEVVQSEEHANMLMHAVVKEAFEGESASTNS